MTEAQPVASACVPCAIGHFATSARLLNETVRFKKDGLTSPQILDDLAAVLGEQNALERIDLTPEKIEALPEWEKEQAQIALDKSRELRHRLEAIQSIDELDELAADTEKFYRLLNRYWASKRLENCPTCKIKPDDEVQVTKTRLRRIWQIRSRKKEGFARGDKSWKPISTKPAAAGGPAHSIDQMTTNAPMNRQLTQTLQCTANITPSSQAKPLNNLKPHGQCQKSVGGSKDHQKRPKLRSKVHEISVVSLLSVVWYRPVRHRIHRSDVCLFELKGGI